MLFFFNASLRSFEEFQTEANHGNRDSMFTLAYSYQKGTEIPQNTELSLYYYQKAADLGHEDAQFNLALMYEYGDGVEQNFLEAMKLYQILERQGSSEAGERLKQFGLDFEKMDFDVISSYSNFHFYEMQRQAFCWLAQMYQDGIGVERDERLAGKFFLKVIFLGERRPDKSQWFDELNTLAMSGNIETKFYIAFHYLENNAYMDDSIINNYTYNMMKEAADGGSKSAQYYLTRTYPGDHRCRHLRQNGLSKNSSDFLKNLNRLQKVKLNTTDNFFEVLKKAGLEKCLSGDSFSIDNEIFYHGKIFSYFINALKVDLNVKKFRWKGHRNKKETIALLKAFKDNKAVDYLSIKSSKIGSEWLEDLKEVLENNRTLRSIKIVSTDLNTEGLMAIANVLPQCPRITRLRFDLSERNKEMRQLLGRTIDPRALEKIEQRLYHNQLAIKSRFLVSLKMISYANSSNRIFVKSLPVDLWTAVGAYLGFNEQYIQKECALIQHRIRP